MQQSTMGENSPLTPPAMGQRATPGFCELPREIRETILRNLLVHSGSIHHSSKYQSLDLDIDILEVNKQLYTEGMQVVYGENCFHMHIWEKYNEERASFMGCDHFANEVQWLFPEYLRVQNYDIFVEIHSKDQLDVVKESIWMVVNKLSESPSLSLKHLRITLGDNYHHYRERPIGKEVYESMRVLQPFALLRNVGHVEITGGVTPGYAEYLRDKMQGNSSLNLRHMYEALDHLARPFDEFYDDIHRAWLSMLDEKIDDFKQIREELVESVNERVRHALDHLLDHDPDHEEAGEWVIEQRRRGKRGRKQGATETAT